MEYDFGRRDGTSMASWMTEGEPSLAQLRQALIDEVIRSTELLRELTAANAQITTLTETRLANDTYTYTDSTGYYWATDPQSGTYDTRQLLLPFPTRVECLARIAAEASETPVGQAPRRGLFGEDLFD